MTRPRAADDFTTIRMRLEELRREREEVLAAEATDPVDRPQPRRPESGRPRVGRDPGLLPSVRRALIR